MPIMRNLLFVLSLCLASGVQFTTAQVDYTVLPGDTYARIARAHDVTLTELQEANHQFKEQFQYLKIKLFSVFKI